LLSDDKDRTIVEIIGKSYGILFFIFPEMEKLWNFSFCTKSWTFYKTSYEIHRHGFHLCLILNFQPRISCWNGSLITLKYSQSFKVFGSLYTKIQDFMLRIKIKKRKKLWKRLVKKNWINFIINNFSLW